LAPFAVPDSGDPDPQHLQPDPRSPAQGFTGLALPGEEAGAARQGPLALSLGRSVARCEHSPAARGGAELVVAHNFHNRVEIVAGAEPAVALPLYTDPSPKDSLAISQLALMAVGRGEVALVPRPIPGAIAYAVSEGLIERDQIIPLDPPEALHNLARCDLLSMAQELPVEERVRLLGRGFVSAFTTPSIRSRAERLGMTSIQRSDSFLADDKREFLKHASAYGVQTCQHVEVEGPEVMPELPPEMPRFGAWMKLSNAMGGCGIVPLEAGFTSAEVTAGLRRLKDDMRIGLAASGVFSAEAQSLIWPSEGRFSSHFGVTIEVDASCYGRKVCVASAVLELDRDGTHRTHASFRQIIGESGEFLGSGLLNVAAVFGPELVSKLEDQYARIGLLCREELRFAGICGVDFIVVADERGNLDVRIIELNARPPISATSYIVGSLKLDAPAWRAPYLVAREPIVSMEQFEQLLVLNGRSLTRSDPEAGRITPLQFGTIAAERGGESRVLRPATWCQVLVSGSSDAAVSELMRKVEAAGDVRFGRPDW